MFARPIHRYLKHCRNGAYERRQELNGLLPEHTSRISDSYHNRVGEMRRVRGRYIQNLGVHESQAAKCRSIIKAQALAEIWRRAWGEKTGHGGAPGRAGRITAVAARGKRVEMNGMYSSNEL